MKIVAITQARVGSSRLPAKVLKKVGEQTLLELHLKRILASKLINQLAVATTTEPDAFKIVDIARECQLETYCGSVNDVLDRFYQTAKKCNADYVVRITSDCPLIDAALIDDVIRFALEQQVDYASNTLEPTFPDGQDVEVFRFTALEKAWKEATLVSEREHVTSYIWKNSSYFQHPLFTSANFKNDIDYANVRLTVDMQQDFETITKLIEALGTDAQWEGYAKFYQANQFNMLNTDLTRNSGYVKSVTNDKLFK